jgi:hypothetical protein
VSHASDALPPTPALSSFELMVQRSRRPDGSLGAGLWGVEAAQAAERAQAAGPPEPTPPAAAAARQHRGHRRPPGSAEGPEAGPALLRGLSFTVRAVLQLAPDLDIPTPELIYTALWAPVVAGDMERRGSEVALLSRERLSEATGMKGQAVMARGGIAERAGAGIGIVRMVQRGVPGAVPRPDSEDWRGEATSWTVTGPLAGFTHSPARTGEPERAVPEGRPLHEAEVDPGALNVWLHPLHPWWGPDSAGPTGMRAVAALITRYGMDDVLLSAADVAAMLGVHRRTAWRALAALTRLGLACPEGKRGRWRVRLRSHLGRLVYDDVKYDQRREPPPSRARARVHDWGWFTREGRGVRGRAHSLISSQDTYEAWTWDFPTDRKRIDTRTGRPSGVLMWVVEGLRRYMGVAEDAARALVARYRAEAASNASPVLPGPQWRAVGPQRPYGPDPAGAGAAVPPPRAPEAGEPVFSLTDPRFSPERFRTGPKKTTAEMLAEMRQTTPRPLPE